MNFRSVWAYLVARAHETSSIIAASGAGATVVAFATGQITGKQAAVAGVAEVVAYLVPQDKDMVNAAAKAILANGKAAIVAIALVALGGSLAACSAATDAKIATETQKAQQGIATGALVVDQGMCDLQAAANKANVAATSIGDTKAAGIANTTSIAAGSACMTLAPVAAAAPAAS